MAAKAFDNLGRLQLDIDRVAAERSFRQAIELAPGFGLAWYGLAQALICQDRGEEGIEASVRAIHLLPKSMARELRAGGHVIYTVEASDDDTCPHRLDPSGRYAHSLVHVSTAATAAGMRLSCVNRVTLRTESGKPVTGWLVTLNRP